MASAEAGDGAGQIGWLGFGNLAMVIQKFHNTHGAFLSNCQLASHMATCHFQANMFSGYQKIGSVYGFGMVTKLTAKPALTVQSKSLEVRSKNLYEKVCACKNICIQEAFPASHKSMSTIPRNGLQLYNKTMSTYRKHIGKTLLKKLKKI